MHSVRKSANMTSITGLKPSSARPIEAPVTPGLADRRRNHPSGKLRRQPLGDLERSTVGIVQVLADQQRFRRRLEQLAQGIVDGLANVDGRGVATAATLRCPARVGSEKMCVGGSA